MPGREHARPSGSVDAGRRDRAQGLEQQVGVVRRPARRGAARTARGRAASSSCGSRACSETPRGHAQVVLEHVVARRRRRRARCRCRRCARRRRRGTSTPIISGRNCALLSDLLGRNDAGLEDLLVVVDVVQEAVERRDALPQARFQLAPLVGRDDARDRGRTGSAARCRAARPCAVDGEGDADAAEDHLGLFAPRRASPRRVASRAIGRSAVVLSDRSPRIGQLLIHLIEFVHGTTNLLEP